MKTKSKKQILYWGVKPQIENRPSRLAKGMAYTNERRARIKNKSTFYHAIITNNKCSDISRRLAVRGTTDILAFINSVSRYNWKRYKAGLTQQRKAKNNLEYLKKLIY